MNINLDAQNCIGIDIDNRRLLIYNDVEEPEFKVILTNDSRRYMKSAWIPERS